MATDDVRYRAFISYSHRDSKITAWVHRTLEAYRVPSKLIGRETVVGPVPRRLTPIFKDRDELPASGDLGREITSALQGSMFLVVICSPAAAQSRWVGQEIRAFKRLHGDGNVLALIVDGEPNASGSAAPDDECFPTELRFKLGPDGNLSAEPAEPIAADFRESGDGKRLAKLKIVAGLTGLRLDDLVRRETQRRMRRLAWLSTAALVGMTLTASLAVYANARRIEADEQRRIAEQEAATARAASDYLVGTFTLVNPATDNPRTITALAILDRSVERARTELDDQPAVQTRLLATLGQAYNNLGLFDEAANALQASMPMINRAGLDGASALLTLSFTLFKQGNFRYALIIVKRAQELLALDLSHTKELRALAARYEGLIYIGEADTKAGIAAFDRALALYKSIPGASPQAIASTFSSRGLLLSDDGQFAAAEASLSEALAINRRVLGEMHLVTGQSWFALAQNAFLAGNLPLAETRIARALAIERRMLDPDNPIIADALSMQGQIFQGQRRLPEAAAALDQAVAIYRARFRGPHYLIGIAQIYLALIEAEQGRTAAALRTLDDAKRNYDASYGRQHANHGDLLVNRATILARAGRLPEARADCAKGLRILGATLGPDASFTRSLAATCAKFAA